MICYARNFEDVILQRVFAKVSQGCYLDVGASIPIVDSNTFALYEKGWRGVAMEPLPYRQQWEQARRERPDVGEARGTDKSRQFERQHEIIFRFILRGTQKEGAILNG